MREAELATTSAWRHVMSINKSILSAMLALVICMPLVNPIGVQATPNLAFSIGNGTTTGTAKATLAIADTTDVECFNLKLSFASGTTLTLPTNWTFNRTTDYYPNSPFGSAPTVELNDVIASATKTQLFLSGFKPAGNSGAVGTVDFIVSQVAVNGDAQTITLSGEYYSISTQKSVSLVPVSATFVVGTNVDTSPPTITQFSLPLSSTSLTVNGITFSATDNSGVSGYCMTETNSSSSCSSWSNSAQSSYTFAAIGAKTLYAFAKDAAGNISSSASANVTIADTSAGPTLTLSTLANGSITNNATLNVSGTVSSTNSVASLTVNNIAVIVTNGSFSYPVILQVGSNIVTTVATDAQSNSTTDTRTINLDVTAPVLTISSPADNSKTAQVLATVAGTVDETSTVSVKVNNGSQQSASMTGNSFGVSVNLFSGINTINIVATDLAGNAATAKRTVTYDNGTLSLSVTNPGQDMSTAQGSITISGTVTDVVSSATITIAADGKTYIPIVDNNGSFSQSIPLTTDKTYAVVVNATDLVGNSATVQRNIIKFTPLTQPSINDALKVLQAVVGLIPLTATEQIRYDVAPLGGSGTPLGNGVLDDADVILILRRSIGIGSW